MDDRRFGRLGYLQLFLHSEYMARAHRQQQRVIEITPKRGAIYDRNMHPLAMSIPVDSAFAVPSELGDEQLAARCSPVSWEFHAKCLKRDLNPRIICMDCAQAAARQKGSRGGGSI